MRAPILQLAFDGLGAKEAGSDAFVDNQASNAVSRGLGYEPNGHRRDDIKLQNVEACHTYTCPYPRRG